MILVAGGTGTLGRELVSRLRAAKHSVRVLTRDPARAAGLDAEVVVGDVRDPSNLAAACVGCSAVVSAVHGFLDGRNGPSRIDDQGNAHLVQAARGVETFVLLSVYGARADHPLELHRAKYAAEQHVRAAGIPWTILRPTAYLETWTGIIGAKLDAGGPALVFGRGENPINFVSVHDVAAVVECALTDTTLRGRTIDVPGPENLTLTELATSLGATKIRHIPRAALAVLSRIGPPAFARQAATALFLDSQPQTADNSGHVRPLPESGS
ncbi:SDR family oxidoreductase [Kribbella sp. NPDC026611]|uniref:SDR family oxidoreductase n=1 Tax=Kribbella sp. NPDC026611 TaxID=3154911 RepID=UPI00340864E8